MLMWWMDGCMDEWMDEGVSGWVGEWVDGWWVDTWDRRMAMFQISAIIGYQGGKEPPDSSSSIPHPHVTPSAQMKAGVDVFLCVGDRWMVTGNTGNYECLTRLALDAASSGEFSQIVPARSHLSVLGAFGCCLHSGAASPVIGWRSCVCTWPLHYPPSSLKVGPVWELQCASLLRLSALLYLLRSVYYTCWGVSLLRPITACRFSRKRMSSVNVPRIPQYPLWGALDRIVVLGWGPKLFSVLSSLCSHDLERWIGLRCIESLTLLDLTTTLASDSTSYQLNWPSWLVEALRLWSRQPTGQLCHWPARVAPDKSTDPLLFSFAKWKQWSQSRRFSVRIWENTHKEPEKWSLLLPFISC